MIRQRVYKIPPPTDNQTQENKTFAKAIKEDPELVPGRYIVVYKDQGNPQISEQAAQIAVQRTEAIFTELNIKRDSLIHQYKYALKGFAAKLTKTQAQELEQDDRVKAVVQDVKYKAIQVTPSSSNINTALMAQTTPWGVARVGGPLDGTGKKAWILDTGIDLDHPDLNVDVSNSVSFVAGENANDGNNHGSHVAGIVAAKNNSSGVVGVAADAQVVAVKVCDSSGYCYTSDLDAGIDYVVSNYSTGDVANISLGWPVSGHPYIDLALSVMENTIEAAADDGLLITIAAGNDKQHANNKSPARITNSNVYVVSSMSQGDNFTASFSCNQYYGSNYGNPPIIYAAPGNNVLSLNKNGGTTTMCGTSMSAPHVAGLLLAGPQGSGVISFDNVNNDVDASPDAIAVADKPLSVLVSGPGTLGSGQSGYFNALVSDEEGSVSYQWYYRISPTGTWYSGGTSSLYQHTFYNSGSTTMEAALKIEISSAGENASDIKTVYVTPECEESFSGGRSMLLPPPPC